MKHCCIISEMKNSIFNPPLSNSFQLPGCWHRQCQLIWIRVIAVGNCRRQFTNTHSFLRSTRLFSHCPFNSLHAFLSNNSLLEYKYIHFRSEPTDIVDMYSAILTSLFAIKLRTICLVITTPDFVAHKIGPNHLQSPTFQKLLTFNPV